MRSITLVQAFQFWLKLTAIAVPVVFLLLAWRADGAPTPPHPRRPVHRTATTVRLPDAVRVRVRRPRGRRPCDGTIDGRAVSGRCGSTPGTLELAAGTDVTLPAGAVVPHVVDVRAAGGEQWATADLRRGRRATTRSTGVYSLLARPALRDDGPAARPRPLLHQPRRPGRPPHHRSSSSGCSASSTCSRRSTGRWAALYAPDLLLTGRTDAVVLLLPGADAAGDRGRAAVGAGRRRGVRGVPVDEQRADRVRRGRAQPGPAARTAADAACAASGSVRRRGRRPGACCRSLTLRTSARRHGRAGVRAGRVDVLPAARARHLVAAAHRRPGAVAGLVAGWRARRPRRSLRRSPAVRPAGWRGALLAQPAAWSMPLAFAVMVVGSLLTRRSVPASDGPGARPAARPRDPGPRGDRRHPSPADVAARPLVRTRPPTPTVRRAAPAARTADARRRVQGRIARAPGRPFCSPISAPGQ